MIDETCRSAILREPIKWNFAPSSIDRPWETNLTSACWLRRLRPRTSRRLVACGRVRSRVLAPLTCLPGTFRDALMPLPNLLFVLPGLPRSEISVRGIVEGREAVSGSHSSFLLVADGLAGRGHRVGVWPGSSSTVTDTAARVFGDLREALEWAGPAPVVVWCSWGDARTLRLLHAAGQRPLMWLQVDIERTFRQWLEQGWIVGIIAVSDLTRLTSLRSAAHRRLGRAYNPLNPFYAEQLENGVARYHSERVVFAGYLGESKGAHRLLQMWPCVLKQLPGATLTIAGSGRLYGQDRHLGPFGVAEPEFERRYLQPLADRFGSLEAAGLRLAGLLAPVDLRELYQGAALGLVNLNWEGSTETFCCTAVEMLAVRTPVLSFARGGLPETIGRSGGAVLLRNSDLQAAAAEIVCLLQDPHRLAALGETGRGYVQNRYRLEDIVNHWAHLLSGSVDDLSRRTGDWGYDRTARYWIERVCGLLGSGKALDMGLAAARRVRGLMRRRSREARAEL